MVTSVLLARITVHFVDMGQQLNNSVARILPGERVGELCVGYWPSLECLSARLEAERRELCRCWFA